MSLTWGYGRFAEPDATGDVVEIRLTNYLDVIRYPLVAVRDGGCFAGFRQDQIRPKCLYQGIERSEGKPA